MEAQQHPTQYILDACSAAYLSADEWPERVWRGLRRTDRADREEPGDLAPATGRVLRRRDAAIQRAEEITRSFTFFLEEGYGYREKARGLPRVCPEAIACAIFEVIRRRFALGESAELPRYLPQLVYIAIAPFTGAEEAIGVIEKLSAGELPGRPKCTRPRRRGVACREDRSGGESSRCVPAQARARVSPATGSRRFSAALCRRTRARSPSGGCTRASRSEQLTCV